MSRYRSIDGQVRHIYGRRPSDRLPTDPLMVAPMPATNKASLRDKMPAIRDQGPLGTCVLNSLSTVAGALAIRAGKPDPVLSRLFPYYLTRRMEGTPVTEDSGCQIRDAIQVWQQYGSPPEDLFPYNLGITYPPTQKAQEAALDHQFLFFYRCPTLSTVLASIEQGFPVVVGFSCPDNLFSAECARTGVVKMPAASEGFSGGHAVTLAAFDQTTKRVSGPNSWGERWGSHGWISLPFEMFEGGYVDDCWTVRREEI